MLNCDFEQISVIHVRWRGPQQLLVEEPVSAFPSQGTVSFCCLLMKDSEKRNVWKFILKHPQTTQVSSGKLFPNS